MDLLADLKKKYPGAKDEQGISVGISGSSGNIFLFKDLNYMSINKICVNNISFKVYRRYNGSDHDM